MSTKAILLQLSAYLSVNNVKRNIGSFVANIQNENQDVTTISTAVLKNNGTYSFTPQSDNKIVAIICSKPLNMNLTFAGSGGITKTVTEMFVTDIEVADIIFENESMTEDSQLTIICG
jgi:hypothetical protein